MDLLCCADAHFAYNYQDRLSRSPTYAYTLAHSSWKYGNYTGNSSYLAMQDPTLYKSTASNTYGWQAYPATQSAPFICEVRSNQRPGPRNDGRHTSCITL